MRFKIGSLVEVSTKKNHPSWLWRCAEIVSVNGDGYTVRYYRRPGIPKESVDRVPAVAVRPCPPAVRLLICWGVGDVVEVLDNGYWKLSVIEQVMGEDCFQIRVIGSLDEFRVKKSDIRVRLEWNINQWVVVEQDSEIYDDLIIRARKKKCSLRQQGDIPKVLQVQESSSKLLKRSYTDTLSNDESYTECINKRRAFKEKANSDDIHGDSFSFIGEVEADTVQKEAQDKNMPASCTKVKIRLANGSRNHDDALFLARTSRADDCVSSLSSVASCSNVDPILDRELSLALASCSQDLCSDAESSYSSKDEERMSVELSDDTARTHDLDLRSYRCVLEALYAFGYLSWEQELFLTNLRMRLCVSNDEHLAELRRLKDIRDLPLSCNLLYDLE